MSTEAEGRSQMHKDTDKAVVDDGAGLVEAEGRYQIAPGSDGEKDCREQTGHTLRDDGMCACGKNRRSVPTDDAREAQ